MSTGIVIASGSIAATYLGIGGSIAGSAAVVPLAPILVTGGILVAPIAITAAAIITYAHLKNKREIEMARLCQKSGDPRFYIQSKSGHICSAERHQESQITSTRNAAQEWEFFELLKAADGRISFRASNGKFVSADRNREGLLIADRDSIADWELFHAEPHRDYVAFRSSDGRYVSRREDNHNVLFALAEQVQSWELFKIMKAA